MSMLYDCKNETGYTVNNQMRKFWYTRRETVFLHSQKGKWVDSVAQLVEHPD